MVVCVGGGLGWWGLVAVSLWCVTGPVPGGGRGGGVVWGWHCYWRGWRGRALCRMGVWASRRVLWVLFVRIVRVSRPPAGRGVEVGGDCLCIRVAVWSVGIRQLLPDRARR